MSIIQSLTSVVLPAASLGLGGFNLVQNTMQQEAIDDRTETLDDLKVAIGALSERIAYLEPASQYATAGMIFQVFQHNIHTKYHKSLPCLSLYVFIFFHFHCSTYQ